MKNSVVSVMKIWRIDGIQKNWDRSFLDLISVVLIYLGRRWVESFLESNLECVERLENQLTRARWNEVYNLAMGTQWENLKIRLRSSQGQGSEAQIFNILPFTHFITSSARLRHQGAVIESSSSLVNSNGIRNEFNWHWNVFFIKNIFEANLFSLEWTS